jgi:hypothetical protein
MHWDSADDVVEKMGRLMRWSWPSDFALVQFPNPPLITALAASVVGYATAGTAHHLALALFYVALSIWAYEEALHGENWFRRLVGLGFGIYIIANLTQALAG